MTRNLKLHRRGRMLIVLLAALTVSLVPHPKGGKAVHEHRKAVAQEGYYGDVLCFSTRISVTLLHCVGFLMATFCGVGQTASPSRREIQEASASSSSSPCCHGEGSPMEKPDSVKPDTVKPEVFVRVLQLKTVTNDHGFEASITAVGSKNFMETEKTVRCLNPKNTTYLYDKAKEYFQMISEEQTLDAVFVESSSDIVNHILPILCYPFDRERSRVVEVDKIPEMTELWKRTQKVRAEHQTQTKWWWDDRVRNLLQQLPAIEKFLKFEISSDHRIYLNPEEKPPCLTLQEAYSSVTLTFKDQSQLEVQKSSWFGLMGGIGSIPKMNLKKEFQGVFGMLLVLLQALWTCQQEKLGTSCRDAMFLILAGEAEKTQDTGGWELALNLGSVSARAASVFAGDAHPTTLVRPAIGAMNAASTRFSTRTPNYVDSSECFQAFLKKGVATGLEVIFETIRTGHYYHPIVFIKLRTVVLRLEFFADKGQLTYVQFLEKHEKKKQELKAWDCVSTKEISRDLFPVLNMLARHKLQRRNYHLRNNNCIHFAMDVVRCLGVSDDNPVLKKLRDKAFTACLFLYNAANAVVCVLELAKTAPEAGRDRGKFPADSWDPNVAYKYLSENSI